ncbi:hypothetical protein [Portibacter marinus]|uniref:hypothetical protein n=1 Tax=Portibacter marinus TaxID=2898660 RepID=UPI001F2C8CC8|nr:hypothetical protein [Portibacter marinus]
MIRKLICKNCQKAFKIKSNAPSRHELEDELGRYFYATCSHCHIDKEYHVNEVMAEEGTSNTILYIILAVSIFMIMTIVLLQMGFIWLVTLTLPAFVYYQLKNSRAQSVQLFNQSNISRTRPKER